MLLGNSYTGASGELEKRLGGRTKLIRKLGAFLVQGSSTGVCEA